MSQVIKTMTKEKLIEKYFEQEKLLKELNSQNKKLSDELSLANNLFENSPTPMWEEDITELMNHIEVLKKNGITNFREYLDEHPDELKYCIKKIKPINVNAALVRLHKARSKEELLNNLDQVFIEEAMGAFIDEITAIANGETSFNCLTRAKTLSHDKLDLELYLQITKSKFNSTLKYTAIVSTVNISEQKKVEQKLVKSEKALRTILDTTEDIAILLDPNGFILESNKACREFYKVKKIDLIGRKLSYFGTEEVVKKRRLYFRKALSEKKTINFENTAYDKIWSSTISPLLDVNGEVEKLVVFHKDITSKQLSEKKLKDSELKFKSIFNNIQTSIIHIDSEGYITDINEYHIKHISKSKKKKHDYIGKNILEIQNIIQTGVVPFYKELLLGKQFDIKNIYFPKTTAGESAYFNIQGIPLIEDGKVKGAILTTEDVTEEVINKQKIVQIEQQLSLALEGAEIGFWEEDIVNNKFSRSNHWFEMLGYQKSDFSDDAEVWRKLVHPDDLQNSTSIVKKHYSGEIPDIRIEHRLKNSNNNYQWILNWGKIIERDELGNPLRAAGIHLDFTQIKRANEEKLQSQQKYKYLFDNQPTIIWEEDFSIVKNKLDALKKDGITDFRTYFNENPKFLRDCAKEIIVIEMNQASLKILDAESLEELSSSLPEYFDSDEAWEVFENEIIALANGAQIFESEISIKTIKGNIKYLYLNLSVNPEHRDTFKSILLSFQDITSLKKSTQALVESQNKYTTLVEQANVGIIINQGWQLKFCNEYFCKMFGYSQDDIYNIPIDNLFAKSENVAIIKERLENGLKGEKVDTIIETEVVSKTGRIFPIEINSQITEYEGKPAVQSIIRDISERKAYENEISKRERQLSLIYNAGSDAMALIKVEENDFRIVSINNSFLKLNKESKPNITKEALINCSLSEYASVMGYSNELSDERINKYRLVINSLKTHVCSESLSLQENTKYFYTKRTPILDENGNCTHILLVIQDITEQKNTEERNRYLAKLLESSPLAYTVTDLAGYIIDVNPAMEELTLYSKDELIGKNPVVFNAEKNAEEIQKNIFDTLANNKVWDGEILNKKKNGQLFYNHSTIFPLMNQNGQAYSFAAFNEDVTERINSNNLIKEQEEYVKSIFSSAPIGIGVVIKRVFSKVNLRLCEMIGYKEEELIGKSSQILYPTLEEFNKVGTQKYSQIEQVGSGTLETKFRTKDGNIINILLSSTPIDRNDLLKGVTFTALDITARKLNEESLRQYANIVSNSSDMLALVDKNYKYLAANKSYLETFNLTSNELIGRSVSEVFGDKFFNNILKPNAEKCMSGKDVNYQEWFNFSNSEKAYIDISYFPYKDDENNILGFVVNARDITKRNEIENKLKESEDKFSNIFKITPYVLIISRISDGKILEFNDFTMQIVGLSREEMLNRTSTDLGLITFEQRSILIEKIKSKGFFSNIELEVRLPSGEKRIGLFHGRHIKLGDEECIFQTILDITDRIKAERQVRESEEKFHKIFRNSPDSIVLTKLEDGEIVEVNDATLKITDVKVEDLIGKKTTEILVWENLSDRERYIKKLSKHTRVHEFEANFVIKEGEVRNCLISGEIIRINNIDYVLGIIRDVTEKKKAETALIASESKYRMLIENQSDLVVEIDKLNQFTFVSPSYCQLFGKNENELLGKSFFPLIHEDDRAATAEEMKKLFNEPYTCRIEQRAMTTIGWRWLEWNDTAQLDDLNNVKSIMGVGRDITDKKVAELALIASEEKFYKIFKNSPDAIILTRMEDGEVIDVNDSTAEITGYSHSEIVGKRTTQIQLWSNLEDRDNYIDLLAKDGIAKSLIVDFIKKDGEKRIGMLSGVLLELNSEKFIFGILRDVTEKTIFEKKLQETNERLRNLAKYMNNVREEERKNFAREVHDNLGQKLTALNLDISWIKQNIPKEMVELSAQFEPVMELINQSIITVQKISTELRPGILDDLGLVNAIQWQSNEISRRTTLNFSLNLFKHEIELDDNVKTALFRVYQEALTNIVRHAEAQNILVNLLIKEKKLIFEVIDDGKGISESHINEFTSFGIIGMKERIASIDGEILFSKLKKGTMIQIKVPIKEQE